MAHTEPEPRRWWVLVVLNLSVLVVVLDNSIVNVAIPTLSRTLDASTSDLQWFVDAYTLVFAGLLLTAGSLGDRFGRRPALQLGFMIFGAGSVAAALVESPEWLIAARALMGVGAAFILPATLSIIVNIFPSHERFKAIAFWSATAGAAAAFGPLAGGVLLEYFYWGAIFLVNVPIVVLGLLAGIMLIPNSRDPAPTSLDPIGAALSIMSLMLLVYAVIEGPQRGWTDPVTLGGFAVGGVMLLAFVVWEKRVKHPMLDLNFFSNPRFAAGAAVITLTFFALFGVLFVFTQYMQFVLGYSALETGVRLLPLAIPTMVVAPLSPRLAARIGTKYTVALGLVAFAVALVLALDLSRTTSYGGLVWRMVLMAVGLGLVMAPATESVMGSLPLSKAGVGSAVNDTTREVGGAVGIAVVGSAFSSIYASGIGDVLSSSGASAQVIEDARESVTVALGVAARAGVGTAGVENAVVDAFRVALLVAVVVVATAVVLALALLPNRARPEDAADRDSEYAAERAAQFRDPVGAETRVGGTP